CAVAGNGNRGGLTRQIPGPTNRQRIFGLGQKQLSVAVFEPRAGELRRLTLPLAFKPGISGPTFKEVLERGLLVPKALLQRHTADVAQKRKVRVFLQSCQLRTGRRIPDFLLTLLEGIGAIAKDRVIDKTHTPKGPGKQNLLLGR